MNDYEDMQACLNSVDPSHLYNYSFRLQKRVCVRVGVFRCSCATTIARTPVLSCIAAADCVTAGLLSGGPVFVVIRAHV